MSGTKVMSLCSTLMKGITRFVPSFSMEQVQDILGFGKVVDAGVISPTVGSEDEGGYIVKLSVGGGALGVTGTVRCTTPGKVTFQWTILVLHVLCAPSPETVEDILTVELDGNH